MKINYTALALASCTLTPLAAQEKPNVILIMADDMGWGDTGFNGNAIIQTPHLDALAGDGVILDRFYAGAPVSSPTRASVLTGRNPFRTGIFTANVGILRPEEESLPEMMQAAGYRTGHFGKWHLGTLTTEKDDANRGSSTNLAEYNPPAHHAYVDACVTESKVPTYDPMIRPVESKSLFWDYITPEVESKPFGTHYWDINSREVTENISGDDSRVVMDRVIPFIDQSVAAHQPFFSVVWFHAPHLPCVAAPEYAALYPQASLQERNYYGCITALDAQVGRLVNYLKAKGEYENTIILFCSDNGPENRTPGTTAGLRGRKRALYEGGIRVPAFMVWKQELVGGNRSSEPCFTSDYLPLIADALGSPLPSDRELDGQSFLPALKNKPWEREKPLVFCFATKGAVIDGDMKLYYENGKYELYNITGDPQEANNLWQTNPQEGERLKKILHAEMASYKDSFEGKEYGTKSVKRLPQKWVNIFAPAVKK